MPIYQFAHPEYGIIIELVQSMKEAHIYIDEEGVEWKRVWSTPNTSIDTQIDPFSSEEFVKKTAKEGMTAGDMMDLSKELSEKRENLSGKDKVRDNYFKSYSKKRKGMKHKEDPN